MLGRADYGEPLRPCRPGQVFGAQSHPEKSSAHGLALLKNFTTLCTQAPA